MAGKWHKDRRRISLASKKKNESDTKNDINSNQTNGKYLLQL